jgi:carbon starvation protein
VTLAPASWLLVCTLTAGWEKLFHADPAIGFLSHTRKFADAVVAGRVLAPASSMSQMRQIVLNDRVDATLCAIFMAVVVATVLFGIGAVSRAVKSPVATTIEIDTQGGGSPCVKSGMSHA